MTDEQVETLSKALIEIVEQFFNNPTNEQEYQKWLEKRSV